MCDKRPDCRVCGPGPGPCSPHCGICQHFKRVEIVDVYAYQKATGKRAPQEDLDRFNEKMAYHSRSGYRAKITKERNKGMGIKNAAEFRKLGWHSRGWWLAWIQEGNNNIGKLMKATQSAYPTVAKVVSKLREESLIRNNGSDARPEFILSNWGDQEWHRYKSGTSEKPGKRALETQKPPKVQGSDKPKEPLPHSSTVEPPPRLVKTKQKATLGQRITEVNVGENIKIIITEPA